jgi:hypothetical protein
VVMHRCNPVPTMGKENDSMRLLLAGILAAAALLAAAPAGADPADCGFRDPLLCAPGQVRYCPDTRQMVGFLDPCASLITGPYSPGGLQSPP